MQYHTARRLALRLREGHTPPGIAVLKGGLKVLLDSPQAGQGILSFDVDVDALRIALLKEKLRTSPPGGPRLVPGSPLFHRRTSSFRLSVSVTGDPNPVTNQLIRDCPVDVEQSGVNRGEAFIRFRASSDKEAVTIASATTDEPHYLSVGYGAHHRLVETTKTPASPSPQS